MRTLKLAYVPDGEVKRYKVITAKNTTLHSPGDVISRDTVDSLSRMSNWEVVIVSSNGDGHNKEKTQ